MTDSNQDLREFALSNMRGAVERVEVDGREYGIRQPTLDERNKIFRAADRVRTKAKKGGASDSVADVEMTAKMQADAVIMLVVDPDTEEQIFQAADYDAIKDAPCNGAMFKLMKAATAAFGVTIGGDAEEDDDEGN